MVSNPIRGRRLKRFFITEQEFIAIIGGYAHGGCSFMWPIWEGIPADAQVVGVNYIAQCLAWQVAIYHSSFDVAPEYCDLPLIEAGPMRIVTVALQGDPKTGPLHMQNPKDIEAAAGELVRVSDIDNPVELTETTKDTKTTMEAEKSS